MYLCPWNDVQYPIFWQFPFSMLVWMFNGMFHGMMFKLVCGPMFVKICLWTHVLQFSFSMFVFLFYELVIFGRKVACLLQDNQPMRN